MWHNFRSHMNLIIMGLMIDRGYEKQEISLGWTLTVKIDTKILSLGNFMYFAAQSKYMVLASRFCVGELNHCLCVLVCGAFKLLRTTMHVCGCSNYHTVWC